MLSPQLKISPFRPAHQVMRLSQMGAAFPTRLSFMRVLLRRLAADGAVVTRPVWNMDADGYGHGVYSVTYGGYTYSLVAFSNRIPDDMRTDRVIAEVWDAAFVLYDGVPTAEEIARLEANAPRQEAGRFKACDLVLSRANKSLRLFAHVVERLADGQQPDDDQIDQVGYLMRTTAVYGNGKFGIADRGLIQDRPGLGGAFQAEMLSVWLIRAFTHDLAEHVAFKRAPETAVKLSDRIKTHLGIGNSTGLGMAPFLVTHPQLLHAWANTRETALARILATDAPLSISKMDEVSALFKKVEKHLYSWSVADARQMARIQVLRGEFAQLNSSFSNWNELHKQTRGKSAECEELVMAMMIDLNAEIVDDLCDSTAVVETKVWKPDYKVSELLAMIEGPYAWALNFDFSSKQETALFWYTSEEKLEPRLGLRYQEPGAELERPLDIARQVQNLHQALLDAAPDQRLAFFFVAHPDLRSIASRVQSCADLPYSEIQDNLIAEECMPIDMLRFKLAMFGASKFDPKSDLWTRITLFQGAPLINQLDGADSWGFAAL